MNYTPEELALLEEDAKAWRQFQPFLIEHLKMWKDSGVPAPVNELQSIAAWLRETSDVKKMQNSMRNRMLILMKAATAINDKGIDYEILTGIFDNRPDLLEEAKKIAETHKK